MSVVLCYIMWGLLFIPRFYQSAEHTPTEVKTCNCAITHTAITKYTKINDCSAVSWVFFVFSSALMLTSDKLEFQINFFHLEMMDLFKRFLVHFHKLKHVIIYTYTSL